MQTVNAQGNANYGYNPGPPQDTNLRDHIYLLNDIQRYPYLTAAGPQLQTAIQRYLNFMYLHSKGLAGRPTMEVEWIWHVHRLHPVAYYNDCLAAFNALLPSLYSTSQQQAYNAQSPSDIPRLFNSTFDFVGDPSMGGYNTQIQSDISRFHPSIDLVNGAIRQKSFASNIQKFMTWNEADIQHLELQYQRFLQLIAKYGQTNRVIVPTVGIDLIWHTRMRRPEQYIPETSSILGKILDHDDNINDSALNNYTSQTQQLWQQEYGQDYFTTANPQPRACPYAQPTPYPSADSTSIYLPK